MNNYLIALLGYRCCGNCHRNFHLCNHKLNNSCSSKSTSTSCNNSVCTEIEEDCCTCTNTSQSSCFSIDPQPYSPGGCKTTL